MGVTHRDLCRLVARWARQGQKLVAYECPIDGGIADVFACTDPRVVPVNVEHARTAKAEHDAVAAAVLQAWRDRTARVAPYGELWAEAAARQTRTVPRVHVRREVPRVVVVEVKRTRADLLADLRAGKMLGYEVNATHCYLAAPVDQLGDLDDLEARGLPRHWGILALRPQWWKDVMDGRIKVSAAVPVDRPAQPIREATPALVWDAGWRIAHTLTNRLVFDPDAAKPLAGEGT